MTIRKVTTMHEQMSRTSQEDRQDPDRWSGSLILSPMNLSSEILKPPRKSSSASPCTRLSQCQTSRQLRNLHITGPPPFTEQSPGYEVLPRFEYLQNTDNSACCIVYIVVYKYIQDIRFQTSCHQATELTRGYTGETNENTGPPFHHHGLLERFRRG